MAPQGTSTRLTAAIIVLCVNHVLSVTYVTELRRRYSWFIHSRRYCCELAPLAEVHTFYINISCSIDTDISDYHTDLDLVNKSADGLWFYVTNNEPHDHDPPFFDVCFDLSKADVAGNCTWDVEYEFDSSSENPQYTEDTTISDPDVTTNNPNTNTVYDGNTKTSTDQPHNDTDTTQSTTSSALEYTYETDVTTEPFTSTPNESVTDVTSVPYVNAMCLCSCPCTLTSQETLEDMIKTIIDDLKIYRNSTALAKRKRLSAVDERWLSRGIGWCGVLVLTAVFGLILAGDAKLLLRDAGAMIYGLKRRFC